MNIIQLNLRQNAIRRKCNPSLLKVHPVLKLLLNLRVLTADWQRCTSTSGGPLSLYDLTNPPGIVLEDVPRVCKETGSELRSLHVVGPANGRTPVGFAGVFLVPGRAMGRRHVGTDVPEGGGATPCATFAENSLSDFLNFIKALLYVLLLNAKK